LHAHRWSRTSSSPNSTRPWSQWRIERKLNRKHKDRNTLLIIWWTGIKTWDHQHSPREHESNFQLSVWDLAQCSEHLQASLNQTEEERKPSKSLDYQPIAVDAVDRGLLEQSKFNRTRVVRNIEHITRRIWVPSTSTRVLDQVSLERLLASAPGTRIGADFTRLMRNSIERTSGMPQPKQVLFCQHNSSADRSWLVEPFAQLERKRWVIWNIDFIVKLFWTCVPANFHCDMLAFRRGSV
jgi:hypothetical protein